VLREAREAAVDQLVIGGDVVPGPMMRESLRALLNAEIPISWILGNAEAAMLAQMRGLDPGPMPESAREIIAWSVQELQDEYESVFAGWPRTWRLLVPGIGKVLFCHGTPRHENEIFTRDTSEDRLLRVFGDLDADLVVCGHTHMQFDRVIGGVRVVNAGSVGMPFGLPGADWLLVGPHVEFRHTEYDLSEAAVRIRQTSYPQAAEFAERNVLHPPSQASMLEVLGRAELRYEPE
jgi:predicted phosphodiesterase